MTYQSKSVYFLEPVINTPEIRQAMESFSPLWLEKHQSDEGLQLYHYTTLSGLQGILKDRALWCGHVSSFNDPIEIQYGQDIATDVLNDTMKQEDHQDVRVFLKRLLVQVQAFGKHLFHVFVACFCESGELLSQWREYADRGGGYSLGFHFSSSTRIASNLDNLDEGKFPFLRKVIYDEEEQRELVQQYVESVVEGTKKAFEKGYPHEPKYHAAVMAMQAANVLLDMLTSFKPHAFKEENEWRLIRVTLESHQPESLQFRKTDDGLVPYRPTYVFDESKTENPQFPLSSIIFGPSLDPVPTRSAIELLLHKIAADSHPIKLPAYEVQIKGAGYSLR